jgi:DNA-binding GntR family transcriptional regulator
VDLIAITSARDGIAKTTAEAIARALRERIVCRELEPGQPLIQEVIAEEFQTSRTPVRDAIRILAEEQLVKLEAHKQAHVVKLTLDELKETCAIIESLEALATRQGSMSISTDGIGVMRSALEQMEAKTANIREWHILNRVFHAACYGFTSWHRLIRLLDQHRTIISPYFHDPLLFNKCVADWNEQHRAIFQACKNGNADEVCRWSAEHWKYSAEVMLDYVKEGSGKR